MREHHRASTLTLLLCTAAVAYQSDQLPRALGPALPKDVDPLERRRPGLDTLNYQFRRTGSPVPGGWSPSMERLAAVAQESTPSVALLTEQRAHPDAIITYVQPNLVSHFAARFSKHAQGTQAAAPNPPVSASYTVQGIVNEVGEAETGQLMVIATSFGKVDSHKKNETNKKKKAPEGVKHTGISRCGFTWDDAAAKSGPACNTKWAACVAPDGTKKNKDSYWFNHTYACYTDLPKLDEDDELRVCRTVTPAATDDWCTDNCNGQGVWCDPSFCDCEGDTPLGETMTPFKIPENYNTSAPILKHDLNISASKLPVQSAELLKQVKEAAAATLSGLPSCTWRPPAGCSREAPYQCYDGPQNGHCSRMNYFDSPNQCIASCIHDHLLPLAPYHPLWYPGPLAKEFKWNETQPRYKHSPEKISLRARGIDLSRSDVMMSGICRAKDNKFVGISLYSPKYKDKAERLLHSCSRVGVCCKATLLPADAFGPEAPEGSEAFRLETIASKPSFILDEIEATHHPVVFLDTDLELHQFPKLFVPGSWPNGPRDLAIFNYWGNETDWKHASTPTTGSGVVFFNKTRRAKNVLRAWAEAMAWKGNTRAPDDQVLDRLLKQGMWLGRVSAGWLPSSYLRTMPAYYRGVLPVIDHDHGNMPGLLNHSEAKPVLPPVLRWEHCDPGHSSPDHRHEAAPIPRYEEENAAEGKDLDDDPDTDPRELPAGTCKAMNPELRGNHAAQEQWNRWCDQNCIPEKWGGVGTAACHGGSATGTVGCLCKAGVRPIDPIAEARAAAEAVAAQNAVAEAVRVKAEEERAKAAQKVAEAKQQIEDARRDSEARKIAAEAERAAAVEKAAETKAGEDAEVIAAEAARVAEAARAAEEVRSAESIRAAEESGAAEQAKIDAIDAARAAMERRAAAAAEAGAIAAAKAGEPWTDEDAARARAAAVASAPAAEASASAEGSQEVREAAEAARAAEAEVKRREEQQASEVVRRRQQQQEAAKAEGDTARVKELEAEARAAEAAAKAAAKAAAEAASAPSNKGSAPIASDSSGGGWEPAAGATSSEPEAAAPEADAAPMAGACLSTNPVLSAEARSQWNGWCVENCKPPAGSPDNCRTPDMTGAAMCACLD